ncbi:hypothetical protein Q428_09440 [Fervidicella metallireducens AeB]|uniref:Permease n=1 Tax=Fervidicella metallireducens AeB TaxID=1403537 RepID=A0A017RU96_9CLOT|nr:permease [Fervidicella metallireducens]EYE88171.1 hypothetical protein Q428_09440 [Fervidicella metallireducens AeB]
MLTIIIQIIQSIWHYLSSDWYILLIGIILAVGTSVYVDSSKLNNLLTNKTVVSIPGTVAIGALTPLCACGTMAVLLSMFVSAMPWGSIMAFLISSPLTSPSEYMFETAFFGSKFATAVLISSIALGTIAGFLANFMEKKTNFFKDQFRLVSGKSESCCTNNKKVVIKKIDSMKIKRNTVNNKVCCKTQKAVQLNEVFIKKYKIDKLAKEFVNIGVKKILFYFIIFIAIGRMVEIVIPQSWIMALFSADKAYSIPLAATIGLPLYLNDSSAIPLLKSLINSGAGQGVVLAFIITGKATGVPVIAGISTFLKKRAILFYIGTVYIGGIIAGYIFQLIVK